MDPVVYDPGSGNPNKPLSAQFEDSLETRMGEPEYSVVLFSWNKWRKLSAFLYVSLRLSFSLGSGLPGAIFLPINRNCQN